MTPLQRITLNYFKEVQLKYNLTKDETIAKVSLEACPSNSRSRYQFRKSLKNLTKEY